MKQFVMIHLTRRHVMMQSLDRKSGKNVLTNADCASNVMVDAQTRVKQQSHLPLLKRQLLRAHHVRIVEHWSARTHVNVSAKLVILEPHALNHVMKMTRQYVLLWRMTLVFIVLMNNSRNNQNKTVLLLVDFARPVMVRAQLIPVPHPLQ